MSAKKSIHLERAKQFLAIAESDDSKYEAYKAAADAIAAHIEKTGDNQRQIAVYLQVNGQTLNASMKRISVLLTWRKKGCPEGTTPFTMAQPNGSKPTDRAAISHAKRVMQDDNQRRTVMDSMPALEKARVIREMREDPAVRRAEAASNLTEPEMTNAQAQGRLLEQQRAARKERRERINASSEARTFEQLSSVLRKARIALRDATQLVRDGKVTDDIAEYVETYLDRLRAQIDGLSLALEDPNEVDWDGEFSQLLNIEDEEDS